MKALDRMQDRLRALYAHRGYVVHSQALTLCYLNLFLIVCLPLLALGYALALPQRAPVAVPPLCFISLLALVTLVFVLRGRLGWAGPILAYAIAGVVMAAQIPKLYGEYHLAFNGFTYVFIIPILIMALFGSRHQILPVALLVFGFNAVFFALLFPRLTQPEHLLSAKIGWAASSVSLLIASGIIFLFRRLMDSALTRLEGINRAISRFVPSQILVLLEKNSVEEIQLGENRELAMAVLFSDLRNFTRLTESLSSLDAFSLVNQYFGCMSPLIRNCNGYVDKYIGDGLLALFHRPEDALVAATQMQQALEELNALRQPPTQLVMGIAIHYGILRLGTVGEHDRMENTVIADTVNTTSRLEGLTKETGSRILLTKQVLDAAQTLPYEELRLVSIFQPRGKVQTVEVYELYAGDQPEMRQQKNQERANLAEAVQLFFEGNFAEAEQKLTTYLERFPADTPALLLLTQCLEARQRFREGNLFEKYGRMQGIIGLIDGFYALIDADPDLASYFRGLNMQRIKGHQAKVFSYLMGATHRFDTSILSAAHHHLHVKPAHFDKAVACFHQCLLQGGVSAEDAALLKARFEGYRHYILGQS
jgi:class 3 adenylate cyclase/truncated hemoglobin YjbI